MRLVGALVAALPLIGCSGPPASPAAGIDPIRIGVITVCEGTFSEYYDQTLAGAELPFIERGAQPIGEVPQGGVTSIPIGGHRVELINRCERWNDRSTTIMALSSLVEQSNADIVIGPLWQGDSIAVREYARAHPDVTFIATGSEQSVTLKRSVPNLYRFEPDIYQWNSVLGMYARRTLGWDTAATLGEGDAAGWQVGGFIGGFCSLGGHVTDRLWTDKSRTLNPGSLVRTISGNVDGLFLPGMTGGGPLGGTGRVVPHWQQTHAPLSRHLLVGWQLLYPASPELRGVVGSSPDPFKGTPAWHQYRTAFRDAFPSIHDPYLENQPYYDGVEPVLQALQQVDGDLSNGQSRFASALARLRYHAPQGLITLDRRHQAIGPVYLGKVVVSHGRAHRVQIGVVKHVHQTLGGYFSSRSPAPSNTQPTCHRSGG